LTELGWNDIVIAFWKKEHDIVFRTIEVVVEHHADGYIAYPLGLKGVVVGQGDTYAEVLRDIESAIRFHVESFGE
jgi:predicted RNase H-like HicB family nuclease